MLEPSITARSEATRGAVIDALNPILGMAVALAFSAKQAHWSVRGPNFRGNHKLFDEVADLGLAAADTVAERIRILGGRPRGTVQSAASGLLPAYPENITSEEEHLYAMVVRVGVFKVAVEKARLVPEGKREQQTFDELTKILDEAEKLGWFLLSHLTIPKGTAAMAEVVSFLAPPEKTA